MEIRLNIKPIIQLSEYCFETKNNFLNVLFSLQKRKINLVPKKETVPNFSKKMFLILLRKETKKETLTSFSKQNEEHFNAIFKTYFIQICSFLSEKKLQKEKETL